MADDPVLRRAYELASEYLEALPARPVGATADAGALREALGGELPEEGEPDVEVLERMVAAADPGIVASAGPRYFGFVVGGALPVALAADWIVSAWDQNPGLEVMSPAGAAVEEVCERWIVDLLGLPEGASAGFVTGAQSANTTCLAAARHSVLGDVGWDVEADGLNGAPPIDILVGDDAHATIAVSLRLLGLGGERVRTVPTDDQGRMEAEAAARMLGETEGPAIVCAQAGEVNTGAFDPLEAVADACEQRGAWLHIDGAFGLWAAASPRLRSLVRGAERADSWTTDAHKWLNVPYDSGIAIVRDRDPHTAALGIEAAYLVAAEDGRDPTNYVPEASRRGRGFPIYAALRSLGRRGVAELVERCCDLARQMAAALDGVDGMRVVNDVVLNQVLVELEDPTRTGAVIAAVQQDGTCWLGGTTWRGTPAIRISFSNWSTTPQDVARSAAAIASAVRSAS
jgi:glutamate/tyrosine decarboxylase-like PLP-dependent enzyme